MIYRLRLLYRFVPEYPRLLGMLAIEAGLAAWWTQSAMPADGTGLASSVAACRGVTEFDFSPTTPIRADWSWFPPGLECRANVLGEWVQYHAPGWPAVVAPTIVLAAGALLSVLFLAQLLYRAALRISGRRLITGAALLCLTALSAVLVFPLAMVYTATTALLVIPVVLAADLGLALLAAWLLRHRVGTTRIPDGPAGGTVAAKATTTADVDLAPTRTTPPTTGNDPVGGNDEPQPIGASRQD